MAIIKTNMGSTDRIARGIIGCLMLLDGLIRNKKINAGVGVAFVIYAITGFDPLLKAFDASTLPGAKDNILHQLMQVAPDKGVNPMLVQQAIPMKITKSMDEEINFAEATAIK